MSSKTPGPGLDITPLRVKMAHADVEPVVEFAANGDQNPITVPHAEMDAYLKQIGNGPEWQHLRNLRRDPACQSSISREYPGLWIRAMINALTVEG